jgi:hypothetical protein
MGNSPAHGSQGKEFWIKGIEFQDREERVPRFGFRQEVGNFGQIWMRRKRGK